MSKTKADLEKEVVALKERLEMYEGNQNKLIADFTEDVWGELLDIGCDVEFETKGVQCEIVLITRETLVDALEGVFGLYKIQIK